MRTATFATALAVGLLAAIPAFAEEDCATAPRDQWLKPEQIKAKAEEMGYTVRSVGEDDGCLAVKGLNKAGAKVEVYFDPVSGAVVKTKED